MRFNEGRLAKHGPHQVAHKSIRSGLPRYVLKVVSLPPSPTKVKSGAGCPTVSSRPGTAGRVEDGSAGARSGSCALVKEIKLRTAMVMTTLLRTVASFDKSGDQIDGRSNLPFRSIFMGVTSS